MLNEKLRMLNKDISAAQVESMQRETLVTCLKSQIEAVKGREAEVTHLYDLAKKQLQEIELEADKQKTINALLKDQVQRLQTEQKSVSQRKWKECMKTLEDMKQRHQEELKPYEAETRKLHSENSSIRFELDRIALEQSSILEKYNQAWRSLSEQKEYCKTHFKDLLQRVTDAEERCEREKARRLCLEQQLKLTGSELAGCKEAELLLQSQFLERQRSMESDLKTQREKSQELQHLLKQSTEKNETLSAALDDARKELKLKIEVSMLEHNATVEALKQEFHEANDHANRSTISLRDECRNKQDSIDALQRETQIALESFERKLQEEREANKASTHNIA